MSDAAISMPHPPLARPAWNARWLLGALALGCLHPAVGSAAALFGGVAVGVLGLSSDAPVGAWGRRLLALGVVGLGAGLDLASVLDVGALGAGLAVASIAFCLGLGAWLGRAMRVDGMTALLVSVGTAICGGSAIAAAAPTVRARESQVTAAMATVFVLNAVALLVFPAVGRALGMGAEPFGLWSAIAIHDTSSVVGAAMAHSDRALEVATTVKLARALWIVPLTLGLAWATRRRVGTQAPDARAARPWFILGFVVAALLVTFVPELRPAGSWVATGARRVMVVALFLIGASLTRPALRAIGLRPLLHGAVLWATVASLSLAAILALT